MVGVPSIGDILMLSQLAWKIGSAFTSGRKGAPAEFQEVENELNSLTTSLTLLAEVLDEDDSIIARADQNTRDGVDKIIESCKQTLDNLNSFVLRYQEIRKPDGENGPTLRSWKRLLIRNYKTISWTGEGGNVQSLRNVLQIHVNSITLTMQALQSKSLSRLENTIKPMANKVDDIHDQLNGDLNVKIDEIHHLISSMAAMEASSRTLPTRPASSPNEVSLSRFGKGNSWNTSESEYSEHAVGRIKYPLSPDKTPEFRGRESLSTSFPIKGTGPLDRTVSHPRQLKPDRIPSSVASIASDPVPADDNLDELPQYERYRPRSGTSISPRHSRASQGFNSDMTRAPSDASLGYSPISPSYLPSPVIPPNAEDQHHQSPGYEYSVTPKGEAAPSLLSRTMTTESQQEEFQRSIFRDSAVLCDVRGKCVQYTMPDEENPPDLKLVEATSECRLCLVTRRQKLSCGGLRFTTSIWALSDDRSVRMQQELPDGEEVIPYTVWGNLEKVSIRVPAELRFLDTVYDAKPVNVAKTSWVNYVFSDERGSTVFQSALMGKSLLLSVQTNKSLRLHDGLIADTFSYQEQMCALENLRIWQDQETSGVMAMIHYSAHFRDGYMAFYLNSSRDPVRIRDDGEKWVKIKGLSILPPVKPSKPRNNSMELNSPKIKPKPEKRIKGARIEFTTDHDKRLFLEKVREVQGMFFAGEG